MMGGTKRDKQQRQVKRHDLYEFWWNASARGAQETDGEPPSKVLGIGIALLLVILVTGIIICTFWKVAHCGLSVHDQRCLWHEKQCGRDLDQSGALLLSGLGLTICYRTGLTSVGSEGQIIMGGLMATIVESTWAAFPLRWSFPWP